MTLAALISLYAVHSMAESTLCITNAYDNIELHITVVVGVAINGTSAGKGVLAISQQPQLSAFGPLQALSITVIGR